MKIKVKHLLNKTPIEIDIPDGYMINVDNGDIPFHSLEGDDKFLFYSTIENRFVTATECGWIVDEKTGVYMQSFGEKKPLTSKYVFLTIEKIKNN